MFSCLWTKSRSRLRFVRSNPGYAYNWIFLPGGPGLGSEYFTSLTDALHLPGNIWHADLPGDGSNLTEDDELFFSNWPNALYELVDVVSHTILVAHSSAGMFALQLPQIEKKLDGIVLLSSSPNAAWETEFENYLKNHAISDVDELQKMYAENPSNELLKELTLASVPYFSLPQSEQKIYELIASLPFNMKTHLWGQEQFNPKECKWIPKIPTLVMTGEFDHITPLKLFKDHAEFHRDNILIRKVDHAAHFPWMENPLQVQQFFTEYCNLLAAGKIES